NKATASIFPLRDDIADESDQNNDDQQQQQQQQFQHLATLTFTIVGMRYYNGVAHANEYVSLEREPHNPYDRNAIRVDSMQHEKVGHIKAVQAALLAPLMDRYFCKNGDAEEDNSINSNNEQKLMVEASVPYEARNIYQMAVSVELYAVGNSAEELTSNSALVENDIAEAFKYQKYGLRWHVPGHESNEGSSSASTRRLPPTVTRKQVDWRQQQQELDNLFDKQSEEQLQNLPPLDVATKLSKLTTSLLEYQLLGVRWMLSKEVSDNDDPSSIPFYNKVKEKGSDVWLCSITNASQTEPPVPIRGGIQADEMGLGKTITTLALMLANPPAGRVSAFQGNGDCKPAAAVDDHTPMPTASDLNTVKVGDLRKRLTQAGISTKGMKKTEVVERCLEAMQDGDISKSSFGTFAKNSTSSNPSFTATNEAVCTMIVCPVSVMSNWITQIDTHIADDTLRVGIYQGQGREDLLPGIKNGAYDVVITSYHTLAAEHSKIFGGKMALKSVHSNSKPPAKRSKKESIFDVLFHRIVLDEGHTIRSSTTTLYKAACKIQAERKWVLTGTPFVNRCSDIHSLFSFLGVQPLGDSSIFKRAITVPMQSGMTGTVDVAMATLRTAMAHVALRRSKATAGVQLVEKTVQIASIEFDEDSPHQIVYNALFGSLRLAFEAIMNDNEAGKMGFRLYNSVFERLLRLRQTCCSARLLTQERRDVALKMWEHLQQKKATGVRLTAQEGQDLLEKLKGAFSQDELHECAICLEEMERSDAVILKTCQHVFCNPCMDKFLLMNSSNSRGSNCPLCRQPFQKSDMVRESVAHEAATSKIEDLKKPAVSLKDETIGSSPKIHALLEAVKAMKPDEKGVIFSQFTSFLDLIQDAMKEAGHSMTRLDGSMTAKRRMRAVSDFSSQDPDSPRFILCSLHAAGVGTNLTRGNHAFMMDTWFNESIENQAMDRIHRLDQTRPVFITRFVMKGSIEERMIALQEQKSLQAKGSVQKLKPEEQRKARVAALRSLLLLDEPILED
ncbi:MAG: hypothetical protein SGILL_007793, partial [Bacillariaceae sp.]